MNEEIMNNETTMEETYTPAEVTEDPSNEDDGSGLVKVALGVGVAAVTGALLLYRATKDKRAAKKQAKAIERLEKAGFKVTAPEDTVDTEAEVAEVEVIETETAEEETE